MLVTAVLCGKSTIADNSKMNDADSSWLQAVRQYRLPEWFTHANRVHAHTRLGIKRYENNPIFREAAGHFKDMGFEVFTRHIVGGSEPAWWPSAVGAVLPQAKESNIAKEIIDNAHAQGMKIIVYYRHMEDNGMARKHPEWICRDAEGKPYLKRGKKMCFNTPYREFVQKRLLELVDMGADGFYFDETHQPDICTCPACRKNGRNREQIIRETFLQYRRAIHKRNPDVVLLVSARFEGLSHDLFRLPDVCKTEPHVAGRYGGAGIFGDALALTFARDAADGRPSHFWWWNERESRLFDCAKILAFGHIFNFDVKEKCIGNPESELYQTASRYASFGALLTPHLKDSVPIRWAIVHYPEGKPDALGKQPVVMPAFTSISKTHVPTGVIIDSQLREGIPDGCGLLVFPDPAQAPLDEPKVARHIRDFKARGGVVIMGPVDKNFKDKLGSLRSKSPVYATGPSDGFVMTAFQSAENDRWVIIVLNSDPKDKKTLRSPTRLIFPQSRKPAKVVCIPSNRELPVKQTPQAYVVETTSKTIRIFLVDWEPESGK